MFKTNCHVYYYMRNLINHYMEELYNITYMYIHVQTYIQTYMYKIICIYMYIVYTCTYATYMRLYIVYIYITYPQIGRPIYHVSTNGTPTNHIEQKDDCSENNQGGQSRHYIDPYRNGLTGLFIFFLYS